MEFVILNDKIVAKEDASFTIIFDKNPFVISQKMWFGFGEIPLLKENIRSLQQQFQSLQLSLPKLFENQREMFRLCKRMLNKNMFYRSGHITVQFYIAGENIQTIISSNAYLEFNFPINEKRIFVKLSNHKKSSFSALSCLKYYNQPFWEMARRTASTDLKESLIFVNEKDSLCEGLAANLFLIKDDVLATPSLNSGCYTDVLRNIIFDQAKNVGLKVIESAELKIGHISEMDEVFLASEANGFQWILGMNNKRFVNTKTKEIYVAVNKFLDKRK